MGPGGWGGQQTVSGADGIHADNVLNISGGTVHIDSAYEGLEANVINVSGGITVVAANDDGVNACRGNSTAAINVTGGYLDVTVAPGGDTDSQMAAAIAGDGPVAVTGGTLIVLGYGNVSAGGGVQQYSLSLHSAGEHTVTVDGVPYTFTNASSYAATTCWSDAPVEG